MKLLVISQYYYPEPFRITDICEELVKRGFEVTVLTGLPNYPEGIIPKEYKKKEKRNEVINGVRVIRVRQQARGHSKFSLFLNYFSYAWFGTIKALFLKERFDHIFIYQLSPVMMAIPGLFYGWKNKIKSTIYCLDLWPDSLIVGGVKKNSFVYKTFFYVSRKIYKSVDQILVTSRSFIPFFHNVLHIKKDIVYLPQYAEDIFLPRQREEKVNDDVNFVFAGNIGKAQSVKTIIEAAELLKLNKKVFFHIVGEGSELKKCKLLAQGLSNVKFYGRLPVTEMPQIYAMADAMLVMLIDDSILSKTLPGKIQSYMAAGKVIIGAINGEAELIIKEARCGYVSNAEDSFQLAENINKFIVLNVEKREILEVNSLHYYNNNFNKNFFQNKLKEIFKFGCS